MRERSVVHAMREVMTGGRTAGGRREVCDSEASHRLVTSMQQRERSGFTACRIGDYHGPVHGTSSFQGSFEVAKSAASSLFQALTDTQPGPHSAVGVADRRGPLLSTAGAPPTVRGSLSRSSAGFHRGIETPDWHCTGSCRRPEPGHPLGGFRPISWHSPADDQRLIPGEHGA